MDSSLPGSSVHEILQARILEWVAMSFSRGSSQPRDRTQVSCIAGDSLLSEPPGKVVGILTRVNQNSLRNAYFTSLSKKPAVLWLLWVSFLRVILVLGTEIPCVTNSLLPYPVSTQDCLRKFEEKRRSKLQISSCRVICLMRPESYNN